MLSRKRLKDQIRKKEPYLNMLEEFDRTGKLKKVNYKERVNFTIDESLMIKFRKFCEENSISMSSKVEKLIFGFLDKKKS